MKLRHRDTGEIVVMTMEEVLEELNRERSCEWELYNEIDFEEGLREFTEWDYIRSEE